MPQSCTCGAELPPDALFCHKCGKPQREIAPEEPEPTPAVTPLPAVEAQPAPAVSTKIHRRTAFRAALPAAIGATILIFLPYLNWIGGGYLAVFLYRRRTGQRLNMESGVRIGWITGLLMFGFLAAILGASMLFFYAAGGIEAIEAQFRNSLDPNVIKALTMLQSGPEVLKLLVQSFVTVNLLSMAGGALGAKLAR